MDSTQLMSDEEAYLVAIQQTSGSVLPMVLKSAIELELLEIIANGAFMSPTEIASHLPTNNPNAPLMVDRILRLLASYSILTCSLKTVSDGDDHDGTRVERLYGLGPLSKFLTKNEDGASISAFSLFNQDKVAMENWYYLKDALLEGGIPFNKAHGMSAFEYPGTDPGFNKIFNNAMSTNSKITMKKILDTYKGFEGLKSVVDIGGGIGSIMNMIISKYPSIIKGINFDLPHVIKDAPRYPGVEHVGGDMFLSVPKGDAIFMKWILHDWSDEYCLKLLKNCYEALPDNGKVIVCKCVLLVASDTSVRSKLVFHVDCIMMSLNQGGKERTEDEFKALAKQAGFQSFQLVCCVFNNYIMEFLKNTT